MSVHTGRPRLGVGSAAPEELFVGDSVRTTPPRNDPSGPSVSEMPQAVVESVLASGCTLGVIAQQIHPEHLVPTITIPAGASQAPVAILEDKHSAFDEEADKDASDAEHPAFSAEEQVVSSSLGILGGTSGHVDPVSEEEAQQAVESKKNMPTWLIVLLVFVSMAGVCALTAAMLTLIHHLAFEPSETRSQIAAAYEQGKDAGETESEQAWDKLYPNGDSLYEHCGSREGGDAKEGVVLYDPDNGVCYQGDQIRAHLTEVENQARLDAAALKTATDKLIALAAHRGVRADDSWRELAVEFAATSRLPQAYEAGSKAFVKHGGDEGRFSHMVSTMKSSLEPPLKDGDPLAACEGLLLSEYVDCVDQATVNVTDGYLKDLPRSDPHLRHPTGWVWNGSQHVSP